MTPLVSFFSGGVMWGWLLAGIPGVLEIKEVPPVMWIIMAVFHIGLLIGLRNQWKLEEAEA